MGRHQYRHEQRNYRDDDQQFYQRESSFTHHKGIVAFSNHSIIQKTKLIKRLQAVSQRGRNVYLTINIVGFSFP
jgi:hypothetical protein